MDESLVILVGFVASIAAYLSKTFVLEPILRFRAVRGRIQNRLRFYSNVITNSGLDAEMVSEVRSSLRSLSCDLEEAYSAIGMQRWVAKARAIPSAESIARASTKLIYLSNAANMSGREAENGEAIDEVQESLKIRALS